MSVKLGALHALVSFISHHTSNTSDGSRDQTKVLVLTTALTRPSCGGSGRAKGGSLGWRENPESGLGLPTPKHAPGWSGATGSARAGGACASLSTAGVPGFFCKETLPKPHKQKERETSLCRLPPPCTASLVLPRHRLPRRRALQGQRVCREAHTGWLGQWRKAVLSRGCQDHREEDAVLGRPCPAVQTLDAFRVSSKYI